MSPFSSTMSRLSIPQFSFPRRNSSASTNSNASTTSSAPSTSPVPPVPTTIQMTGQAYLASQRPLSISGLPRHQHADSCAAWTGGRATDASSHGPHGNHDQTYPTHTSTTANLHVVGHDGRQRSHSQSQSQSQNYPKGYPQGYSQGYSRPSPSTSTSTSPNVRQGASSPGRSRTKLVTATPMRDQIMDAGDF